ncbi:PASTA domain-containing protein [Streptomyces sp. NPDC093707]|uniref:PASTA domain-containing protein n=1 Tax=Streptomyces sp. NPDC093707 TaxID=3154984 RepID=UPI00344FB713
MNSKHPHPTRAPHMLRAALVTAVLTLTALTATSPAHAGSDTMPDVRNKRLTAAYQALHHTAVQLKDGRGAGRHVLWPSNWKVCAQQPRAGAPLKNQKVTLTVVKSREACGNG